MDAKTKACCEARADILKAMAHPTRLFMLETLAKGERCVCDLAELTGADVSTVSKHLSILRNAGMVKDEKRGLQVFYQLCCPCLLDFLRCAETVLKANAKRHASVAGR